MISPSQVAEIRRLFHVEHWKVGTIASQLSLHPDTVESALATDRLQPSSVVRQSLVDPYREFLCEVLRKYPRLRSTRLYAMIRDRGYQGSVVQLRRIVRQLRPSSTEVFLKLHPFPADQAQVDWADFGPVRIGRAKRRLSCFVLTLSYSRALWVEFFLDQTLENFCLGHVHAFEDWQGVPRIVLHDNLKSAVLERRGEAVHFHPRFLELAAHYHFGPRPCRPARGNEKGRVERAIQYIRHSFFAARPFTTLADLNRQVLEWREQVAHQRPWPGDDSRIVVSAFAEEQPRLIPLPAHPFSCERLLPVQARKIPYIRFDLNDYSIPPECVKQQLLLAASPNQIRILHNHVEIASHRRSYDRHQTIEDPHHLEALIAQRRKALAANPGGRLAVLVPLSESFLDQAFLGGESVAVQAKKLLQLLEDYGPEPLSQALQQALDRGTPRASSVAYLLQKQHRTERLKSPYSVKIPHRPELEDLAVPHPNMEVYDALLKIDPNQ